MVGQNSGSEATRVATSRPPTRQDRAVGHWVRSRLSLEESCAIPA